MDRLVDDLLVATRSRPTIGQGQHDTANGRKDDLSAQHCQLIVQDDRVVLCSHSHCQPICGHVHDRQVVMTETSYYLESQPTCDCAKMS